MIGESRLAKGFRRHGVGIVEVAFQLRGKLAADARDVDGVETRIGQRQFEQFERLVEMARQGLHVTGKGVAIGAKTKMDGVIFNGVMKAARVIGAGAFVDCAGEQGGDAGLVGRVLRRAAAQREFNRDQRHGVAFDQPCRQTAGRDDALHMFGAGRHSDGGSSHVLSNQQRKTNDAATRQTGSRKPVTARRLSSH